MVILSFGLRPRPVGIRGLCERVARGRAWGGFLQMLAVTPPCGEAVCGADVGPAVVDGRIDFQIWLAIVAASILREYYR